MNSIRVYIASAVLLFLVAAAAAANAGEMRRIELVDGSIINGDVVSLSRGVYTVKSATLGTLRIRASDVLVIRMEGPVRTEAGEQNLEGKTPDEAGIVALMRALQNDPDLQKMLQDPEIMKAVEEGDIAALMRNPAFTKLLDRYRLQEGGKNPAR